MSSSKAFCTLVIFIEFLILSYEASIWYSNSVNPDFTLDSCGSSPVISQFQNFNLAFPFWKSNFPYVDVHQFELHYSRSSFGFFLHWSNLLSWLVNWSFEAKVKYFFSDPLNRWFFERKYFRLLLLPHS